ncbi:unnamed protein product [Vitrella brassicaformis CCMP3155]|uniref:Uncharacterized protein n=1 Tax=Vitrella brassicaformis (strain CCMP3155) TaxID=1169540 RepID=A0A0G4EQ82_VITBC|nr:unnamed protein product [Vitrella brassicaformis CCMP3155]|eukprot:CEL99572.1 unnamed protein product [Vitrella brassicaformis CCMP3155]
MSACTVSVRLSALRDECVAWLEEKTKKPMSLLALYQFTVIIYYVCTGVMPLAGWLAVIGYLVLLVAAPVALIISLDIRGLLLVVKCLASIAINSLLILLCGCINLNYDAQTDMKTKWHHAFSPSHDVHRVDDRSLLGSYKPPVYQAAPADGDTSVPQPLEEPESDDSAVMV